MKILITGAGGFIGKNLCVRLAELDGVSVIKFTRENSLDLLPSLVSQVDFVVHLAGINRATNEVDFNAGNQSLTEALCEALLADGRSLPIIFSSSIQAENDSTYGVSKRETEQIVRNYASAANAKAYIYRLPNIFGKWCRPHYNSVVATFCHNIARGQDILVKDPAASIKLLYIDDLVDEFVQILRDQPEIDAPLERAPIYDTTVGDLAEMLLGFHRERHRLFVDRVGAGLTRALYATYVSYLPVAEFSYPLVRHADARGEFVEMLKTFECGQFSYFTAFPGVVRGGHYHHTKTEKFLIIRGTALFRFRNLISNEFVEVTVAGGEPRVVESIPGWAHDVKNIGNDELIVMIWANEVFDKSHPDTVSSEVV